MVGASCGPCAVCGAGSFARNIPHTTMASMAPRFSNLIPVLSSDHSLTDYEADRVSLSARLPLPRTVTVCRPQDGCPRHRGRSGPLRPTAAAPPGRHPPGSKGPPDLRAGIRRAVGRGRTPPARPRSGTARGRGRSRCRRLLKRSWCEVPSPERGGRRRRWRRATAKWGGSSASPEAARRSPRAWRSIGCREQAGAANVVMPSFCG